jgi:hypothetical protein
MFLFAQIKAHPAYAAIVAVACFVIGAAGFWSAFNVDDALVPTLWAAAVSGRTGPALVVFGSLALTIAAAVVLTAIVLAAAGSKRLILQMQAENEARTNLVVFQHIGGNADLADRIRDFFVNAGWTITKGRTDLDEHAEGVRIINGPTHERTAVSWALSTLGVNATLDPANGGPFQVVVGRAQPITLATFKGFADVRISMLEDELRDALDQREKAVVALKETKSKYAIETLRRHARLIFSENRKPHVTIRYFSYGPDYELAMKLKGLFTQYVEWPVALDATNSPALPRADKFKVVFDVGMTALTYGELINAISDGDFLEGATIGQVQFVERKDSEHLIVSVLPSGV